ncbi:MAG: CRISPR-associated protein Csx10 [Micromonosporaceae bacterium]|jgi:CRISPR-associated protein Csx10|nr:CRISPR-associated protein Csx10 [Micromonosporaceae bacterium]
MTLSVTVVARQRLALGVGSELSYFTDSHRYVPGSVLRGALAAAWITQHAPPTAGNPRLDEFRALFDGVIRYGPLHVPASNRKPLSARFCKYPQTPECEASGADLAFDTTTACPFCERRWDEGKGDLELPPAVALERSTRTSINPATGRAADGELYAHAALPAGTKLTGTIHGQHPWLEEARPLRLGGRRTVGGAADYTAAPSSEPPGPDGGVVVDGRLVIRLVTPAVFVDQAGRPRLDPDPVLDLDGAEMDPERSWSRAVNMSGWHAASRLPKPGEVCAAAGSTYVVEGPATLLASLAQRLTTNGIGLRRTEGFGVVEFATNPWRPMPPDPQPDVDETVPHQAWLAGLNLADGAHRWFVGALRSLQIEQQRSRAAELARDVLDALLSQPTAADLPGLTRDSIRTRLSTLDAVALRELTAAAEAARRTGGQT